ncbi:TonB-dependent receptor [Gammaproteobacteria bacterium AB-CW1]|uniref:TonB-dependent receptor n=2 Tax=Natronospira TaxID=2024969 RepID=A0AAP6JI21_9GAMM|nr:TonB-dependent receptor [Gammaproteobacteria bacterium AB-CW1]
MKPDNPLRRAIRLALLSGMAAALAAPMAMAQNNDNDEEEELRELDRVRVTGTRITREGIDTHYPALSISSQELEDRGFTNVADALNELPSFGAPPITPDGTQNTFNLGQNFVDFLGLGSQRTLTLVNGRRFVSQNTPSIFAASGGLQVDFNVIPVAMVDRIEVIGIGGAPIYGSDAIAGTINVILKDDYEGVDFSLQRGITAESDAQTDMFSYVAGANMFDGRGNVTFSVEWFNQEGLEGTARPDLLASENNWFWGVDPDGVRRLYNDSRMNLFAFGGLVSPGFQTVPSFGIGAMPNDGVFYQFDENSDLVPFQPGTPHPNSAFFAIGGDGADFFREVEQLRSPLERKVITSSMNYDLTDDVRFSSDFLFSESSATELTSQGGFQTWAFGGTSGPLFFESDHPFLSDQAQQLLADNGLPGFWLHRFNNDIIDPSSSREQNVWRWTAGLDGEIFAGNRRFDWDVSVVAGESKAETRDEGIIDGRFINALDVRVLTQDDLDAVDPNDLLAISGTDTADVGDMICESVYQAALGNVTGVSGSGITAENIPFVDGCIPLNLFGEGVRDPAARDWVTGDRMTQTRIGQAIYTANFGGDLFELPGGMSAFNVGYETRREDARFIPGLGTEVPLTRSAPFAETGGSYKTDEFYGELFFPVFGPGNQVPLAHRLEFNAAVREIENNLAGDATVWSLGGVWAPVRDVAIRGNYTESIRAPSLVELFAPQTQVFSFANDPCDFRFVDSGPDPDTRRENCEQDLGEDPDGFTSEIVNATGVGRSGGNPDLENEFAESYALGVTFEPRWVDNLVLTTDYYHIEIEDAITSLSLTDLMEACYDSPDFPIPACNSFTRDEDGQVADFLTGQTNAQEFRLTQLNVGLQYRFDVSDFFGLFSEGMGARDMGTLGLNTRFSQTRDRTTSVAGDEAPRQVGGFGQPKNRAIVDTTWTRGDWRVFWRTDWTRRPRIDPRLDNIYHDEDGRGVIRTRSRHIHNASVSYNFGRWADWAPQSTVIQFTVNNLFDREPNRIENASGHFGMDEILGRRYQLTLRGSY